MNPSHGDKFDKQARQLLGKIAGFNKPLDIGSTNEFNRYWKNNRDRFPYRSTGKNAHDFLLGIYKKWGPIFKNLLQRIVYHSAHHDIDDFLLPDLDFFKNLKGVKFKAPQKFGDYIETCYQRCKDTEFNVPKPENQNKMSEKLTKVYERMSFALHLILDFHATKNIQPSPILANQIHGLRETFYVFNDQLYYMKELDRGMADIFRYVNNSQHSCYRLPPTKFKITETDLLIVVDGQWRSLPRRQDLVLIAVATPNVDDQTIGTSESDDDDPIPPEQKRRRIEGLVEEAEPSEVSPPPAKRLRTSEESSEPIAMDRDAPDILTPTKPELITENPIEDLLAEFDPPRSSHGYERWYPGYLKMLEEKAIAMQEEIEWELRHRELRDEPQEIPFEFRWPTE